MCYSSRITLSCQTPQCFYRQSKIVFCFIFSVRGHVTCGKKGVFVKAIRFSIDFKASATFCLTTMIQSYYFPTRLRGNKICSNVDQLLHKQGTCFLQATFFLSNVNHETTVRFFLDRYSRGKEEFFKATELKMPSVSTSLWLSVDLGVDEVSHYSLM